MCRLCNPSSNHYFDHFIGRKVSENTRAAVEKHCGARRAMNIRAIISKINVDTYSKLLTALQNCPESEIPLELSDMDEANAFIEGGPNALQALRVSRGIPSDGEVDESIKKIIAILEKHSTVAQLPIGVNGPLELRAYMQGGIVGLEKYRADAVEIESNNAAAEEVRKSLEVFRYTTYAIEYIQESPEPASAVEFSRWASRLVRLNSARDRYEQIDVSAWQTLVQLKHEKILAMNAKNEKQTSEATAATANQSPAAAREITPPSLKDAITSVVIERFPGLSEEEVRLAILQEMTPTEKDPGELHVPEAVEADAARAQYTELSIPVSFQSVRTDNGSFILKPIKEIKYEFDPATMPPPESFRGFHVKEIDSPTVLRAQPTLKALDDSIEELSALREMVFTAMKRVGPYRGVDPDLITDEAIRDLHITAKACVTRVSQIPSRINNITNWMERYQKTLAHSAIIQAKRRK